MMEVVNEFGYFRQSSGSVPPPPALEPTAGLNGKVSSNEFDQFRQGSPVAMLTGKVSPNAFDYYRQSSGIPAANIILLEPIGGLTGKVTTYEFDQFRQGSPILALVPKALAGTSTFGDSNTFSASGSETVTGTATFGDSSTFAAAGSETVTGTGSFGDSNTFDGSGSEVVTGTASFGDSATFDATGVDTHQVVIVTGGSSRDSYLSGLVRTRLLREAAAFLRRRRVVETQQIETMFGVVVEADVEMDEIRELIELGML